MERDLEQTIWRGIALEHPPDWELVSATAGQQPARCVFADRRYERLKVQWRSMAFEPQLKKMLEEKALKQERDFKTVSNLPPGWHGIEEKVSDGLVVHAGRFFQETSLFMEAILLWPVLGKRDRRLENSVLSGMGPAPDQPDGRTLWRAMGLRVKTDPQRQLLKTMLDGGHQAWAFGSRPDRPADLGVRRIALPKYWLHAPLEDWLKLQLDDEWKIENLRRTTCNGHTAARMTSSRQAGARDRLGGRRRLRTDLAWQCSREERVYHVQYEETRAGHDLRIPDDLEVACCAPSPPSLKTREPKRTIGKKSKSAANVTALDILESVPIKNTAIKLCPGNRGGAMAEVALRHPWFLRGPIRWLFPVPETRRVALDAAGMAVLDLCDGKRTVERVIEDFARRHRLSFREAQTAAMDYLRQLSERGIVVIAGMTEDRRG